MTGKQDWAALLHQGEELTWRGQLALVVRFSIPAIVAELTTIAMEYIDAAMVGSLGGAATASIGLVSSTTWLINGLCLAAATGFSVQLAHLVGAGEDVAARKLVRQALLVTWLFSLVLSGAAAAISGGLPVWLGGGPDVTGSASRYFLIYALALPAGQLRSTAGNLLQCSGNMRTPSLLNAGMCGLDVLFNSLLIFPNRTLTLGRWTLLIPGAGLGVAGAALGTALAQAVTAALMLYALCVRSPRLRLTRGDSWRPERAKLRLAVKYAAPMALEHIVLCGAQIATTRIVAPLGTVSVAANSLAVTAEGLCYMPAYGMSGAATTLVGQSIGAGRGEQARRFARLTVFLSMAVMALSGAALYALAPAVFTLLTADAAIRELGSRVLRIEAFAEPLFGASIVAAGAMRGAGDTLVPSVMNLASMWGVRITASLLLAPRLGLRGVWIAMCGELCVRGVLFLARLLRGKWLTRALEQERAGSR